MMSKVDASFWVVKQVFAPRIPGTKQEPEPASQIVEITYCASDCTP
eukprot:COSAG06_NODE_4737_length_3991_cov_3.227903_2_plen_46_part_00